MTKTSIAAAWAVVACSVLAGSALAQVDAAAEQVLHDSAEAIKGLDSVSYKAKRFYSGGPLDGLLDISGQVKIVRDGKGGQPALWLTGSIGVKNQEPTLFTAGSDGQNYSWLDKGNNTLYERPMTDRKARQTIENYTNQVLLDAFVAAEPYAGAFKATTLKQTGVEEIGGVLCNIIEASSEDGRRTVYHIGVADLLPRREAMIGTNDVAKVLEIQDLKANAELKVNDLTIAMPEGYRVDRYVPQPQAAAPQQEPAPEIGLAAGTPAPAFELATLSGEHKSLANYKGNVVVLSFWGPVFSQSEACLNMMQELSTYFDGQEIKFVGIACREPDTATTTTYVQQRAYTFDVLTGGTEVAASYNVLGFPSVVVLDKAGAVSETFLGCPTEDQLLAAVEKAAK
jgi:peroxiredoxin